MDYRKICTAAEKRAHVKACLERKAEGHTIRSYINAREFSKSAMNSRMKAYRAQFQSLGSVHEDVLCTQVTALSRCVGKNPAWVRALMRSYAGNTATPATIRTIRDDIALGDAEASVSEKTISQHLAVLDRIFVMENLPAWNPVLRSKTAIRT